MLLPDTVNNPRFVMNRGFSLRSDIQIYLDVLELMHAAAGGEGVKVLFRILNRDRECPELLVTP